MQTKSSKWAQRCPADEGDVIEIRQILDEADFAIQEIGGGHEIRLLCLASFCRESKEYS